MSEYFTYTALTRGALARASDVNQRFQQVETGFGLLPASAKLKEGRVTYYAAGGTGNVLTVTMSPAIVAYTDGLTLNIKLTANNSGASTLNVNGLGAIAIKRVDGSALVSGDLVSGEIAEMTYDGSVFRLQRQTGVEIAGSVTAAAASAAAALASQVAAAASAAAAAVSAANAATSETNAAGYAASINPSNLMHLTGAESAAGVKTFSNGIIINGQTLSGLTANGKALIEAANYAAMKTLLGLTVGTDVQAYDAELAAIAGLTSAADRLPYFTGSGTAALATFTTAGRALVDDADASTQLSTLGFSAFGKTIIDDADGAAVRTTIAAAGSGLATASGLTQSTGKLLGRTTAATGAIEEITPGAGLSMSSGNLIGVAPLVAALAADQTMTSITTITGMTGSLAPGQYELECLGEYKCSATTTGIEPALTISGVTGTVNSSAFIDIMSSASVITSGGNGTLAGAGDIVLNGANVASNSTFYGFKMKAHVFVDSGGAATFAFRAGAVDGASTITIRKGSVSIKRTIA